MWHTENKNLLGADRSNNLSFKVSHGNNDEGPVLEAVLLVVVDEIDVTPQFTVKKKQKKKSSTASDMQVSQTANTSITQVKSKIPSSMKLWSHRWKSVIFLRRTRWKTHWHQQQIACGNATLRLAFNDGDVPSPNWFTAGDLDGASVAPPEGRWVRIEGPRTLFLIFGNSDGWWSKTCSHGGANVDPVARLVCIALGSWRLVSRNDETGHESEVRMRDPAEKLLSRFASHFLLCSASLVAKLEALRQIQTKT